MKIGFYIGALLYQHDCVVIPGFGGFIANYTPAFIHPVQNTFTPPSRQIMFNASLLHNDGLLASHIAHAEGIGFDQALIRITEEVALIQKEVKSGKSVIIEGLGSLRANQEDNIIFTPRLFNNYLEDAYGLATFVSPAIRRNGYHSGQNSGEKSNVIHLPVAVKRIAAIAVPLIAIGLWSLFNTDRINNFTSNYSSIFPSELVSQFSISSIKKSIPIYVLSHSKSSPVKHAEVNDAVTKANPAKAVSQPVTTNETASADKPAVQTPVTEVNSVASGHFMIISGAFKVKENANKLVTQLKAKDLDATIAGQNKKGLYLVCAASCDDAGQATLKLKEVLGKGIDSAWILKK
jgi:hypothetical protein